MKNFKRKLIRTTISLGAIGLIGATGYHINKLNKENNFKRIVTEEGEYELTNSISYDNLIEYSLCEIKTITTDHKLYIAKIGKSTTGIAGSYIYAYDIFTDKNILEGENTELINNSSITDYLVAYDMIKAKYSNDDLEELLEKIRIDYNTSDNKILSKESR